MLLSSVYVHCVNIPFMLYSTIIGVIRCKVSDNLADGELESIPGLVRTFAIIRSLRRAFRLASRAVVSHARPNSVRNTVVDAVDLTKGRLAEHRSGERQTDGERSSKNILLLTLRYTVCTIFELYRSYARKQCET